MSPQCAVRVSPPTASTITSPGSRGRDGVVEREVVAGRALHGERRPERVRRRPRGLESEQHRDAIAAGRGEQSATGRHVVPAVARGDMSGARHRDRTATTRPQQIATVDESTRFRRTSVADT